jgi:cytochrome c peroxidase
MKIYTPVFFTVLCCSCFFIQCKQPVPAATVQQQLVNTGRHLFYDRRLSVNNTRACGSCHAQEFSFTDNYVRSIGALGDLHQRNARPLINLTLNRYLTAADSSLTSLLQQMDNPLFNTHPVEMGMKGNEAAVLQKIKADTLYRQLFAAAFPGNSNPFTINNIKNAIAAFEQSITACNAPYDAFMAGNKAALTAQQLQGRALFFSDSLQCGSCHGGKNFSEPLQSGGAINFYQNTGLYNLNNKYPAADQGLFEKTGNENDKGKFRIPTLRNLQFTAPYYHDGSALSLEEVIKNYERGGRYIATGSNKGDGKMNPYKSPLIRGFAITLQQRQALISFLYALTDSTVLTNPAYANPFTEDETKR